MQEVKRVDVKSTLCFSAYIFGIIGFIVGTFYAFGGLVIDLLVSLEIVKSLGTAGLSSGTLLAFGAIIGIPILFTLFGACFGGLLTFLYNRYAKTFGGIKIECIPTREKDQ